MTFQLGIVFPGHIILASDKKYTPLYGNGASYLASKIHVRDNTKLVYCHSGDTNFAALLVEEVETVIDQSRSDLTSDYSILQAQGVTVLVDCAKKAKEKHEEWGKKQGVRNIVFGSTFFVFQGSERSSLWCVDSTYQIPTATAIQSQCVKIGTDSAAIFFTNYYLGRLSNDVESMITLAVHTVLMAKSQYVEDIEICVFSDQQFKVLDDSELRRYIHRSEKIDAYTLAALTTGRP